MWPEHWDVWELWQALKNDWRLIVGLGGAAYAGLDKPTAESVMRMWGIKKRRRRGMLEALLIMEEAALPVLNDSAKSSETSESES